MVFTPAVPGNPEKTSWKQQWLQNPAQIYSLSRKEDNLTSVTTLSEVLSSDFSCIFTHQLQKQLA